MFQIGDHSGDLLETPFSGETGCCEVMMVTKPDIFDSIRYESLVGPYEPTDDRDVPNG